MFAQDSTLTGDVDCSGEVNSQDASLILQFVTNVIDELPCQDNMTGLTPEQLQEIINMMDEQLNINYSGGGGNDYPAMISSISSESLELGEAFVYCNDLDENGYTDWFLPNLDQLAYAISGGCELPDERTGNQVWSTTVSTTYDGDIYTVNEDTGAAFSNGYNANNKYCRCVRFGEGETSEGSSGSSNSSGSGSSVLGSEQPITMIGPMYLAENSTFISNTGNDNLFYFEAIRFCSQLVYEGFDDWVLPSFLQIQNYAMNNDDFIIPNFQSISSSFWTRYSDINGPGGNNTKVLGITIYGASAEETPNTLKGLTYYSPGTGYFCFCVR